MFIGKNMFVPEENDLQIQQTSTGSDDSVRFYGVCFEDVMKLCSLQGYMLACKYKMWSAYEYIHTKSLAILIKSISVVSFNS